MVFPQKNLKIRTFIDFVEKKNSNLFSSNDENNFKDLLHATITILAASNKKKTYIFFIANAEERPISKNCCGKTSILLSFNYCRQVFIFSLEITNIFLTEKLIQLENYLSVSNVFWLTWCSSARNIHHTLCKPYTS